MNNHSLTNQRPLVNKLFLAGIIFIIFVFVFTNFQEANAESENHLKKVAAKRMQFWNTGSVALVEEVFTPDYILHLVGRADPEVVGTESLIEIVNFYNTAYPDMNYVADEVMISGDRVIMRLNFTGTNTGPRGNMPPTGKIVNSKALVISKFKNGKISEEWVYVNRASVYRQLGYKLIPPSAQK
jgi:steroid delta-isomerase-like uncharacterized protein